MLSFDTEDNSYINLNDNSKEYYQPFFLQPSLDEEPITEVNIHHETIKNIQKIETQIKTKQIKRKSIFSLKPHLSKKKVALRYEKNICGYILQKTFKSFNNPIYKNIIQKFCENINTTYENVINYHLKYTEKMTGPSFIPNLFSYTNKEECINCSVLIEFFKWFLKERYIRHLISEGKMTQKEKYINYKNKELLPIIFSIEKQLNNSKIYFNDSSLFDIL